MSHKSSEEAGRRRNVSDSECSTFWDVADMFRASNKLWIPTAASYGRARIIQIEERRLGLAYQGACSYRAGRQDA